MTDGNQDPAVGAADREAYKREQQAEQGRKAAKGCGLAILGFILLAFIVGALSTCGGETPAPAQTPKTASGKAPTAGELKGAVMGHWKQVLAVMSECDQAALRAGDVLQEGDAADSYSAVKRAQDSCLSTSSDIRALGTPALVSSESKAEFTKAMDLCSNAYVSKWSAFGSAAKAIDEGMRPSLIAEFKDSTERASLLTTGCLLEYNSAATTAGVTLDFKEMAPS